MSISKKILISSGVLLLDAACVNAAVVSYPEQALRRSISKGLVQVSNVQTSSLRLARHNFSDGMHSVQSKIASQNSTNYEMRNELKALANKIAHYQNLLISLMEEMQQPTDLNSSQTSFSTLRNSPKAPTNIIATRQNDTVDLASHAQDQTNNGFTLQAPKQEPYYNTLEAVPAEIRNNFIQKVIQSAPNPYEGFQQDLVAILDVLQKLIKFNLVAIEKVLSAECDSSNSNIYAAMVRCGSFHNLTIDNYRTMYTRLCKALGKEGLSLLFKIASEPEQKTIGLIKKFKSNPTRENYITAVVWGANPIYPLRPSEVANIVDVYKDLNKWTRERITKILSTNLKIVNSNVYSAVAKHAQHRMLTIARYREIYSGLSMSVGGWSIQNLFMIDELLDISSKHIKLKPSKAKLAGEVSIMAKDKKKKKIEVSATSNEAVTLKHLYKALSQFRKEDINAILSGENSNPNSPILLAMHDAIDTLQTSLIENATDAGAPLMNIDFQYFQLLYALSHDVKKSGKSITRKAAGSVKKEPLKLKKTKTKSIKVRRERNR